jgi:alcohol dehydrogenase (cytochrome c)
MYILIFLMNDFVITMEFNHESILVATLGAIVSLIVFSFLFPLGISNTTVEAKGSLELPLIHQADLIKRKIVQQKNDDNWTQINHDIYGTRTSNQTTISKDSVGKLQVKWVLYNQYEIQDPPIIVGRRGYVQDYVGNIISFDTSNGTSLWNTRPGNGPTMGLIFDKGIIFASTASDSKIVAINATDGKLIWKSRILGDPLLGYSIDAAPIVWKDFVIAGSGGSGLPPGLGMVKGNITALNRTDGKIIWNIDTTTGDWVSREKTPPNGGATAWSGGSLDPQSGILYVPLGSASPNFNASTRLTPNLYSNHVMAVNVTNGKIIWTTPFIAPGTVLNVSVPDTHDWDTSWGTSISQITTDSNQQRKLVIGHDKMGNVIAMDASTGKEIWWKELGIRYNASSIPSPNGSGTIWAYGVYNYHAVDNDTVYIPATNRGLNFFTDGISGHKVAPPHTIEQGLRNGTIFALELATGNVKWKFDIKFPPRVSPLVTDSILFCGYIPFTDKAKSGVILALDKESGRKLWEYNTNAPIGPVGPSIGDGMLFVPTGKVDGMPNEVKHGGSIIAFGLP